MHRKCTLVAFAFVVLVTPLLIRPATNAAASQHAKRAEKRTKANGYITSLSPCGGATGGGTTVTFTAKATFSGVGIGPTAENHTITLRLLVLNDDGGLVCSESQSWEVANGEEGCIDCPVSCMKQVDPGVYFLNAILSDVGPDGKKVKLDAKSCAVILSQ